MISLISNGLSRFNPRSKCTADSMEMMYITARDVMRDGELQTERDNDTLANGRERTEFAIFVKEFGAGEIGGMVNCRQR